MATLAELGLREASPGILLVGAPDAVLAEAGRMKPRPSSASTLQTAEPTARILWWPARSLMQPAHVSRLRWMIEMARGEAWVVVDPEDEESATADEVLAALAAIGMPVTGQQALSSGETAIHIRAANAPA